MRFLNLFIAFPVAALVAASATAFAATNNGGGPGGHLTIEEVSVDFETNLIVIKGRDFDFGSDPVTVLLGSPDLIQQGTPDEVPCILDVANDPEQTITCDFSGAGGLPPDGDYQLSVFTGNGQSQGDQYNLTIGGSGGQAADGGVKFVFVTSTAHNGNFGGVTGADAICEARAYDAYLPGTYKAWLSDGNVDAINRLPADGGPWFNLKGEHVAASRPALANASNIELYNAIKYDEKGSLGEDEGDGPVWTGTLATGLKDPTRTNCDDWTSGGNDLKALTGDRIATTVGWTDDPFTFEHVCADTLRLYCFQE